MVSIALGALGMRTRGGENAELAVLAELATLVQPHPSDENRDVARVGHPKLIVRSDAGRAGMQLAQARGKFEIDAVEAAVGENGDHVAGRELWS